MVASFSLLLLLSILVCCEGFVPRSRCCQGRESRGIVLCNASSGQPGKVQVFSTLGCSYCRRAKAALTSLGAPFDTVDVSEPLPPESKANLLTVQRLAWTKQRTVPQIFVGDDHVGGCDELLREIDSGAFLRRLSDAGIALSPPLPPTLSEQQVQSSAVVRKPLPYLNYAPSPSTSAVSDPVALSIDLQRRALLLADQFSSPDGSAIRYSAMLPSSEMAAMEAVAAQLHSLPLYRLSTLSFADKLSFWANLYNTLVIHATAVLGPVEDSPAARGAFFRGETGAQYSVGGVLLSPDDIEHGILRCNAPHPGPGGQAQQEQQQPYFSSRPIALSDALPMCSAPIHQQKVVDERLQLVLPRLDPRIHFALNCGARSCPAVKIMPGDGSDDGAALEAALAQAAKQYLLSSVSIRWADEGEGLEGGEAGDAKAAVEVTLPKLLLWYGRDFSPTARGVVARVASLLIAGGGGGGEDREAWELSDELKEALLSSSGGLRTVYGPYSWAAPKRE